MANLAHPRLGLLRPGLTKLPFGRYRMVTTKILATGWDLADELVLAWGTAYATAEKHTASARDATILANLVLIDGQEAIRSESGWVWVRIYETLTTTLARYQADVRDKGPNGLGRTTRSLIALPAVNASAYVVGTQVDPLDTASGRILARLRDESDDRAARFSAEYLQPGTVAESTSFENNGALERRDITSFHTVPSTPAGFILVDIQNSDTLGYPTRVYRFAKGVGIVSRQDGDANNGALLTATIRGLSAPGTLGTKGTNPYATLSGYVLVSDSYQESEGHRVWTSNFAKGEGEISREVDVKFNGVLTVTTVQHLTTPGGFAPSALTGEFSRDKQERDGHVFYLLRGATGAGIVEDNTQTRFLGKLTVRTVTSVTTTTGTAVHASGEIRFSSDARDGYAIHTSIGVSGSGRISTSNSTTANGSVRKTRIQFINTDDTAKPAGLLIDTGTDLEDGYTVFSEVYGSRAPGVAAGSIVGSVETDWVLLDYVRRHVVTSVDAPPTSPPAGYVISTETTSADGVVIYRTIYIEVVNANLPDEVATRLDGAITITTKRKINSTPTIPALVRVTRTDVQQAQGYTIFSTSYVTITAPLAGFYENDISYSLNNRLVTVTRRQVNVAPTAPSGVGVTYLKSINESRSQEDGYVIYTTRWVYGEGLVDTTDDVRSDGSVVTTKVYLNVTTGITTPADSYLINQDNEPGNGYNLITVRFYKPPANYTQSVNVGVRKPGRMGANSTGLVAERTPANVNITATASVVFTAAPTVVPATPISAGCVAYERAVFTDGKNPELLFDSTGLPDYYAGTPAAGSGPNYRGRPASGYSVSFFGAADQSGLTLTFSCEAEPYFRSEGVIVYKVTTVTGVL